VRVDKVQFFIVLGDDQIVGFGIGRLLVQDVLVAVRILAVLNAWCGFHLLLPHLSLHSPRGSLLENWRSCRLLIRGACSCSSGAQFVCSPLWRSGNHWIDSLLQVAIPHGQLLSLQCLLLLDEQLLLLLVLSFLQASRKYGHLGEERVGGVHEDAGAGLLAQNLRLASGIRLIPYALHILLLVAAYFGQHVLGQWQLQELEHALLCGELPVQGLLANPVPVVLMLADALNQLLDVKIRPLLVLLSINVTLASSSRAIDLHQYVILGLDALWILSVRGIVSWLFSIRI